MTKFERLEHEDVHLFRRRASDRARERAGRAAYLGDRAGLLIATATAASLMSSRSEPELEPASERGRGRAD
jgi:hypothetical protein